MTDADSVCPSPLSPIRLVGTEDATVDDDVLADLPIRERECEIVCSTGDRYTDTWRGVPMLDLLEQTSVPLETTHVLVESVDGHRACVAIEAALDGLLAFERDGTPLAERTGGAYASRFVASGVAGPRTVKDVTRIETAVLEPGEDPEAYEDLTATESE